MLGGRGHGLTEPELRRRGWRDAGPGYGRTPHGPWSAGRAITVTAGPPTPAGLDLFAIMAEPGNGYGGNSTQARVLLNQPVPAGGALVTLASDIPQAEVPARTVTIPAGRTDAFVSPVTTGPVPPKPRKEADGKTTRERLRDCYLSWSTYNVRVENIGPRCLASSAIPCYSIFSQNPRRFGIFGKTSWPW
jgi:hypothetical protein